MKIVKFCIYIKVCYAALVATQSSREPVKKQKNEKKENCYNWSLKCGSYGHEKIWLKDKNCGTAMFS